MRKIKWLIPVLMLVLIQPAFATQPKAYKYYVGPWVWDTTTPGLEEGVWKAPTGTVGMIDLRTIAAQGKKTIPDGYGFFAVDGTLPAPYVEIANGFLDSATISNATKNQINQFIGYKPTNSILRDVIWEILTTGSDATGLSRVRPLMPTVGGELELWLGGHSLVKREHFIYGVHPHTQKVREVLQHDYRKMKEEFDAKGSKHYLKVLDFWREKYNADPNDFIPDDLPKEKPLRHETTITESFNKADSTTLGPDLSWTEIQNDLEVSTNEVREVSSNVSGRARADSDLSTDDHYAKVTFSSIPSADGGQNNAGVICRKDSSATLTYYAADHVHVTSPSPYWRTYKVISSTATFIGTDTTTGGVDGDTIKLDCDGSSITRYKNGASQNSVTDTAITGNLRTGVTFFRATGVTQRRSDNFEAGDLGGAAGPKKGAVVLVN